MTFNIVWYGVKEFTAAIEETVTKTSAAARAAVVEAASEVEKKAKQGASGRPGPNVISGTLRRGIIHDPVTPWGVGGWETKVGPTAIYSRRIELGFIGTDRIGRHYNQPPFPYFTPAWKSVDFAEIYRRHWLKALSL